ncbi:hypothetical protein BH20ACI1_BH20ACI1_31650 [soil metagenome]
MKKNKKNKDSKMPKITIDESLNQYQGKVIFKTTLMKANETLKNVKLPKALEKTTDSA